MARKKKSQDRNDRRGGSKPIVIYSQSRLLDNPPQGTGPLGLVGRELAYLTQRATGNKRERREQWVGSIIFNSITCAPLPGRERYSFDLLVMESLTGDYAMHVEDEDGKSDGSRDDIRETKASFSIVVAGSFETRELPPYCPEESLEILANLGILLDLKFVSPPVETLSRTQILRLKEFIWWFCLRLYMHRKKESLTRQAQSRISEERAPLQKRFTELEQEASPLRAACEAAKGELDAFTEKYDRAKADAESRRSRADQQVRNLQNELSEAEAAQRRAPEIVLERETRASQVIAANGADSPQAAGAKRAAETARGAQAEAEKKTAAARRRLNDALRMQRQTASETIAATLSAERAKDAAALKHAAVASTFEPVERELGELRTKIEALDAEMKALES